MNIFLANTLLMVLWVAATGEFTLGNALLGFGVSYLALWWLQPLMGKSTYFGKFPLVLWYSLLLLGEVVKSNIRVAWDVLTPQILRRPGIVGVPLDAQTDLEITMLANLITFTPGTLSLDVSDDRRTLYVHVMFMDNAEAVRREIKEKLERRVLKLLR